MTSAHRGGISPFHDVGLQKGIPLIMTSTYLTYMSYPILLSFRNFRSRLSIYPVTGVEVIPRIVNLYTSLQKLEDDSNFWLRESWSSEFIRSLDWKRLFVLFRQGGNYTKLPLKSGINFITSFEILIPQKVKLLI